MYSDAGALRMFDRSLSCMYLMSGSGSLNLLTRVAMPCAAAERSLAMSPKNWQPQGLRTRGAGGKTARVRDQGCIESVGVGWVARLSAI